MVSDELTLREVLLAESYDEVEKIMEKRIAELEAALRDLHAYLKSGSPLDAEFRRVWDENLERLYEP